MAYGMGMGGGFDSSSGALGGGLGAGAFGGDEKEMPWYSPYTGISVEQLDPSKHTTNPQLDAWGRPINSAYNWGPFDTRYGYGSGSGLSIAKAVKDAVQDAAAAVNSFDLGFSIPGYGTPPANPHAGFMDQSQLGASNPNYSPSISLTNPVNTTPTVSPAGSALLDHFGIGTRRATPQEDIDALLNEVLGLSTEDSGIVTHGKPKGMKVSSKELPASVVPSMEQMLDWNPIQFDTDFRTHITHPALMPEARQLDPGAALEVLDTMGIPWGVNAISNISHSDTEREYAERAAAERAAAERALYSQIANQITQAAGQSSGRQAANAPVARPVVIPTVSTPGRPAENAPAPVRHDPIANLVRTVLSPKINQVKPETVKAIKRGKKPDYSIMSDYQQDLVRNILNPPKPPVSSNYSSIENR